jgi:ABC-type polysaccharide/polyol phosphate transport system ATPase subunit
LTDPAIEFRGVTLSYRISSERGMRSLKEWAIRRMLGRAPEYRELVALYDVSFAVPPGRALGVVGHNGAGKSTLLRVAGGILAPTRGEAITRGRLAPIIELGIGFEFELSGRENIFFNGALLGRSPADMDARMEEIIEFSDLGDFIDRPLRTYSTGMVTRLAFAIATTVDAHILLLDEVMAVGDEAFKRKCERRIASFRDAGVTIMVVSHDLDAIAGLCDEALWLEHGRLRAHGPADEVVERYRGSLAGEEERAADIGGTIQLVGT